MVKKFAVPDGVYPDDQCNAEIYCADRYLELETLGPLVDLPPAASTSFSETWEFYSGAEAELQLSSIFPTGND